MSADKANRPLSNPIPMRLFEDQLNPLEALGGELDRNLQYLVRKAVDEFLERHKEGRKKQ